MTQQKGLNPHEKLYDDGCQKVKVCDSDENPVDLINDISLAAGTNTIGNVKITDGIETATINSEGRLDVVQHSHVDSGAIHFDVSLAASTNFTLIDISDIVNYPHSNTVYAHLEWLRMQIDSTAAGDYEIELGFLENVDASNSDIYVFSHVKGTKTTGQNKELFFNFYPNGQRCKSANLATHDVRQNDVTFQTDVNQKTTLDPSTADTVSGSGDVVMLVTVNAGTITIVVESVYHSH